MGKQQAGQEGSSFHRLSPRCHRSEPPAGPPSPPACPAAARWPPACPAAGWTAGGCGQGRVGEQLSALVGASIPAPGSPAQLLARLPGRWCDASIPGQQPLPPPPPTHTHTPAPACAPGARRAAAPAPARRARPRARPPRPASARAPGQHAARTAQEQPPPARPPAGAAGLPAPAPCRPARRACAPPTKAGQRQAPHLEAAAARRRLQLRQLVLQQRHHAPQRLHLRPGGGRRAWLRCGLGLAAHACAAVLLQQQQQRDLIQPDPVHSNPLDQTGRVWLLRAATSAARCDPG
jgi:hypothetical protein